MKLRSHTQHKPVIYYEHIAKRNGKIRFRMNGKQRRNLFSVKVGDFGTSWLSGYEVLPEFLHRIPYTILLGSLSMFVSVIIGIPLGIIAAIRQYHFVDYASLALALVLFSLPSFWLAMMCQILFCLTLGWLPASGVGSLSHSLLRPCSPSPASALFSSTP